MQLNSTPPSVILIQNPPDADGNSRLMFGMRPDQPRQPDAPAPLQRTSPRPQPAVAALQAALPQRTPSATEVIRTNTPVLLAAGCIANATGGAALLSGRFADLVGLPVPHDFETVTLSVAPVVMAAGLALFGTVGVAYCLRPPEPAALPPALPPQPAEPLPPLEMIVLTVDPDPSAPAAGQADTQAGPASAAAHADDIRLDVREIEPTPVAAAPSPPV